LVEVIGCSSEAGKIVLISVTQI